MLLMGNSQLRQAAAAFREVEKLGRFDGPLNLARVMFAEGELRWSYVCTGASGDDGSQTAGLDDGLAERRR